MTGCFACCCYLSVQTYKGFGLAAAALSQHMLLFGADCWMAALAVAVTDSCRIEWQAASRLLFGPLLQR